MYVSHEGASSELGATGVSRTALKDRRHLIEKLFEAEALPDPLALFRNPLLFQLVHRIASGGDWSTAQVLATLRAVFDSISANAVRGEYPLWRMGEDQLRDQRTIYPRLRSNTDQGEISRRLKLAYRTDSHAVQDGYKVQLQFAIVNGQGECSLVNLGLRTGAVVPRLYFWGSVPPLEQEFFVTPHTAILGEPGEPSLNLMGRGSEGLQHAITRLVSIGPDEFLEQIRSLDGVDEEFRNLVEMKRVASIRALVHMRASFGFQSLLMLEALGHRTLQSLAVLASRINELSLEQPDSCRSVLDIAAQEPLERLLDGKKMLEAAGPVLSAPQMFEERDALMERLGHAIAQHEKSRKTRKKGRSATKAAAPAAEGIESGVETQASRKRRPIHQSASPIRRARVKIAVGQLPLF